MPTSYFPGMPPSTPPNRYQDLENLQSEAKNHPISPSREAQGRASPTAHQFPVASNLLATPPKRTFPSFAPSSPMSGYQGFGMTFPRMPYITPPRNRASPMIDTSCSPYRYHSCNTRVGMSTSTRDLRSPVQGIPKDFSVEDPPCSDEEDELEDGEIREEPQAAPQDLACHICANNPNTVCPGHGSICVDKLSVFIKKNPDGFSPMQVLQSCVAVMSPKSCMSPGSPGKPCSCALGDSVVSSDSPSPSPTGPSIGKRPRSEADPEGRPIKQQRACAFKAHRRNRLKRNPDDSETQPKSKRPVVDGEYICLLCRIFDIYYDPLSSKDSLKRHIKLLHPMFKMLYEDASELKRFEILKPRHLFMMEDLNPLIEFCLGVQFRARKSGKEIGKLEDLALLYPALAASMNLA